MLYLLGMRHDSGSHVPDLRVVVVLGPVCPSLGNIKQYWNIKQYLEITFLQALEVIFLSCSSVRISKSFKIWDLSQMWGSFGSTVFPLLLTNTVSTSLAVLLQNILI